MKKSKSLENTEKSIEQVATRLQDSESLLKQAAKIAGVGHFVWDWEDESYLVVSEEYCNILGIRPEELRHFFTKLQDEIDIVHPADRERVERFYQEARNPDNTYDIEYRLTKPHGGEIHVREVGETIEINHGQVRKTIGVLQDITEQKQLEEALKNANTYLEQQIAIRTSELENTVSLLKEEILRSKQLSDELYFLANHDDLTGAVSMRQGRDRIQQALAEAKRANTRVALMYLDLDGFKEVNDSYGHKAGDRVLITVVNRIKAEVREIDTVARFGGDEFLVIIKTVPDLTILERIATSLIRIIGLPVSLENGNPQVGVSIGIALYPENGATEEALLNAADMAMYQVKKSTKNDYGFAETDSTG